MLMNTATRKALAKSILFLTLFAGFTFNVSAQHDHDDHDHKSESHSDEAHAEESSFDAGEMIMHHISDAHEIHIIGDFAIYLPIILYTEDGFDVFSSSHFYHNEQHGSYVDDGGEDVDYHYYTYDDYALFHEHIYYDNRSGSLEINPETGEASNEAVMDLSITKSVTGVLFTCLLLILIFSSVARSYKKRKGQAPKGLQSFLEPLILFIRDEVAIPSIGSAAKADKFMPFLLTTFFFIWIANMLGLIPFIGGFNITGTLSVTMVLAALVFIIITINGNKHYWGHILWPAGVPLPIKFILVPIEIASIFIKPLVLMVRLTANITAGHIIILAFVSLVLIFGEQSATAGYGVGFGSVLFMIFMFFIELLVAFLQAYVFTLLAALYFGEATQEGHH
ncbi:F0F1 ATP synthase subunit A [Cryomorphaceae bacterium 1068]|nr:F0F1 ATP synthase subunit A [Cryomorphaceae bacterium 1068]